MHNHPSGDAQPSEQDKTITRDVVAALRPLGIVLHDHVVIGKAGHFSFRAEGLL